MYQSKLFTKTRFEAPKDEVAKNALLLLRAGFIHKEMAGVYTLLPLGLKVVEKIRSIIREEMNAVGGQEISLTALQAKELWEKTGRWDDAVVDNWFKTELKNGTELGLGFSHEEPLTNLMRDHLRSYKDFPVAAYQFQVKFRNEARAKSGILRGREFLMKDMYTFCKTKEEQEEYYEKIKEAYVRIYKRVGIGETTFLTFASGGVFSKYSHEFQTITDAGEDTIYVSEEKKIAVNKEVFTDEVLSELGLTRENLVEKKAIEVGNIFNLSSRFSDALGLYYTDEKGEKQSVQMGCYGIGLTRLLGTVVEVFGTENKMVWPESLSPFKVHLVDLSQGDSAVKTVSDNLYGTLLKEGVDTLYDDRDMRAGEKFADADLIGIPLRIIIGKKGVEAGAFEVKDLRTDETKMLSAEELVKLCK